MSRGVRGDGRVARASSLPGHVGAQVKVTDERSIRRAETGSGDPERYLSKDVITRGKEEKSAACGVGDDVSDAAVASCSGVDLVSLVTMSCTDR